MPGRRGTVTHLAREPYDRPPVRITRDTVARAAAMKTLAHTEQPMSAVEVAAACREPYGTVYPALRALVANGWVQVSVEDAPHPGRPARHLYTLTEEGRFLARKVWNA